MVAILITIVIACTAVSATTRRATLSCKWERASTLAVMLLGLGVALTATPLAEVIIAVLDWGPAGAMAGALRMLGHICLLLAAGSIATAAAIRIDGTTRDTIARWVALPLCGCVAIMLVSVLMGQWLVPDLWRGCLSTYLFAYSCGLAWLLGYAILALLVLTEDPKQRKTALMYAAACAAGLLAHIGQWVLSWIVPAEQQDAWATIIQICILLWVAGFALAAAHSWRAKLQPFRKMRKALQSAHDR